MKYLRLPEWILLAALRHALTQQSVIVSDVAELVEHHLCYLTPATRKKMAQEIGYALPGLDVQASPLDGYYHDIWRYLRGLLQRSLEEGCSD